VTSKNPQESDWRHTLTPAYIWFSGSTLFLRVGGHLPDYTASQCEIFPEEKTVQQISAHKLGATDICTQMAQQMSTHKPSTTDVCTQTQYNRCLHTRPVQQMSAHKWRNRCLHTNPVQQMSAHKTCATDVCTQTQYKRYMYTNPAQLISEHKLVEAHCSRCLHTKPLLDSSRPSRTQFAILIASVTWLSPHLCFRLEDQHYPARSEK
jgi:hypothetical protein